MINDPATSMPGRTTREAVSSHKSSYAAAALWLIVLGTAFHLAYSTHLELVGDEAYYWLWSRHPDICYLDKGPMIAWLIWLGTAFFGQTVFGIRFFAVLLASGTGVAIWLLARHLFSDRVAFWAIVIATIIPLFAVGASLMTIDTVYIFFWSWAAVAFWRARTSTTLAPWLLTGVLVGLGLLSKYTAALELVSFAAFCLWDRASRQHFRRATFWVMVATALLFLIPAIIWNYRHHWPTSDWLVQRGALDKGYLLHPGFLFGFLGEQAGVISPFLFIGLLFVLLRPSLRRRPPFATAYTLALFLPLFGLYLLLGLHYLGPPNWPAAAYIGGVILLAAQGCELIDRYPSRRWLAFAALAFACFETGILLETRWLSLPHRLDPLDRARGSRNLAAQVDHWQHITGARFVIADNYMTAALLSFYLPGQPEVFVPASDRPLNELELWANYDARYPAADSLIVSKRSKVVHSLSRSFGGIKSLGSIDVTDRGRDIGHYCLLHGRRKGSQ